MNPYTKILCGGKIQAGGAKPRLPETGTQKFSATFSLARRFGRARF
jgi:hypothetical protein